MIWQIAWIFWFPAKKPIVCFLTAEPVNLSENHVVALTRAQSWAWKRRVWRKYQHILIPNMENMAACVTS